MRRIETITNNSTGREARVYRDSEWQEWRVNGQHQTEADHHTDDKGDAQCHARAWAWGGR